MKRSLLIVVEGLGAGAEECAMAKEWLKGVGSCAPSPRVHRVSGVSCPSRWGNLATLMTGVSPDQHGVLSTQIPTVDGVCLRSIVAQDRQAPAFWERLDQAGVRTWSVGWPSVVGAHLIHGAAIDREFGNDRIPLEPESRSRLVVPAREYPQVAECWMKSAELRVDELAAFVPRWQEVDQSRDPLLAQVAGVVSRCVSQHAAFLEGPQESGSEVSSWVVSLPLEFKRLVLRRAPPSLESLVEAGWALVGAMVTSLSQQMGDGDLMWLVGLPDPDPGGFTDVPGILLSAGDDADGCVWEGALALTQLADHLLKRHGAEPVALQRERALFGAELPEGIHLSECALPVARWWVERVRLAGLTLARQREWERAIPYFERVLAWRPDAVDGLVQLIEAQYFAGDYRSALENAKDLQLVSGPDDLRSSLIRAGLEAATGNLLLAHQILEKVPEQTPSELQLGVFYARVLVHLRIWDQAESLLGELIKTSPERPDLWILQARCLLGRGELLEACTASYQALLMDSTQAEAHEIRGMAFLQLGMLNEAWKAWWDAVRLQPDRRRIWGQLRSLGLRMGVDAESLAEIESSYQAARDRAREQQERVVEMAQARLDSKGPSAVERHQGRSLPTVQVDAGRVYGVIVPSGVDPRWVAWQLERLSEGLAGRLLEHDVSRPDDCVPDLPEDRVHIMPAAWLYRLPRSQGYHLIMMDREGVEILRDRKHLPNQWQWLPQLDLEEALARERAALLHFGEISPNLQLSRVAFDSGVPGERMADEGRVLSRWLVSVARHLGAVAT
ncbi:tetratricopeptide (TPR) repeat protein [Haloferula luteola]|uniref:Tetratricopeptide (TPR) repeat protein n=1 Tax=Haloferula luteola TaxID=595692 RepID=A0A840VBC0_9BACT|nr:tetratricopeptide repeat protein [Haloferula luteola]MBB5351978.1 tetratricopeptide (TPR) repeat protein [Haloferula luteola]